MRLIRFVSIAIILSISVTATAEERPAPEAQAKAILVTGASSGLGLRMTEVLSKNGFIVYAGARKLSDLKRLEAMDNVESIRLDVTKQDEIDAAVELVQSKGRGLYGLINNAGVAVFGPAIEVPVEEIEYQFDVNVLGPYRVTQAFAPMLIESKGRIATTGSIAGILSGAMFAPYSMSKHAIEAYTDSLAAELARFDVQVSVIEPGNFASQIGNTGRTRMLDRGYWKEDTQYSQERAGTLQSLAKVTEGPDPLPVAEAALHIMSSDQPKLRYMVTNANQATITIRRMMTKALQLNQDQPNSFSREQLIEILDEELEKIPAAK